MHSDSTTSHRSRAIFEDGIFQLRFRAEKNVVSVEMFVRCYSSLVLFCCSTDISRQFFRGGGRISIHHPHPAPNKQHRFPCGTLPNAELYVCRLSSTFNIVSICGIFVLESPAHMRISRGLRRPFTLDFLSNIFDIHLASPSNFQNIFNHVRYAEHLLQLRLPRRHKIQDVRSSDDGTRPYDETRPTHSP